MHLQFVILSFFRPALWSLFSIEIKYKFVIDAVVYKRNACAYINAKHLAILVEMPKCVIQ